MKSIKITLKGLSVMLLCASVFALVSCGSAMTVSQPTKKQASTTTSTSTPASASTSKTKAAAATNTNASNTTATTVDGQAKADGTTSKGRKGAK